MNIIIVSCILIIMIIGFIKERIELNEKMKEISFAKDFNNTFIAFIGSKITDMNKYQFLIYNSNKMQNLLGTQGILASMKPPYANYILNNYPIILNGISDIKKYADIGISDNTINGYIQLVNDSLIRFIGSNEMNCEIREKNIYNPLVLFLAGIQFFINIPLSILQAFNILNDTDTIKTNIIYRIVSGIIALITFISSIITIIFGWEEIIKYIKKIF